MNPLSPKQILRNLENGFFMTHQEQTEAADYIRQLQQSNEALKEGLIKNAEEMFNLRKKLAKLEQTEKPHPYQYVEVRIKVGDFHIKKVMTEMEYSKAHDPIKLLSLLADDCVQHLKEVV